MSAPVASRSSWASATRSSGPAPRRRGGTTSARTRWALAPSNVTSAPPAPCSRIATVQPVRSSSVSIASAQVVWPRAQTCSPTAAMTMPSASSSSSSTDRPGRPAGRRDRGRRQPHVDRVRPGVRRHFRVDLAEERLAEPIGQQRFADPGQPERPDAPILAQAARPEPGQRLVAPHRPHLARRAGQRDDHAAVRSVDPPARGRPVRVGERLRPTGSARPA